MRLVFLRQAFSICPLAIKETVCIPAYSPLEIIKEEENILVCQYRRTRPEPGTRRLIFDGQEQVITVQVSKDLVRPYSLVTIEALVRHCNDLAAFLGDAISLLTDG